jgi:hypothetical protein
MGMGLGMPPLLPNSEGGVHIGWMVDRHCFPPQTVQPDEFHNFKPFEPYQSLAPRHFSHQPSDFESMDASGVRSTIDDSRMQIEMHYDSPIINISSRPYDTSISAPLLASSEKCVSILLFIRSVVVALHRKISISEEVHF